VTQFLPGKPIFYVRVLQSVACVAFERKAADEITITITFKSFGENKINELGVTVTDSQITSQASLQVVSGWM
jgi:hypothetical protein